MRLADLCARALITVGGIGTIVAVATVCLFLVSVVVPLFLPARSALVADTAALRDGAAAVHVAVDEYRTIGYTCSADGTLHSFRMDSGALLSRIDLVADLGAAATAWSFALEDDTAVIGLEDGRIQVVRIGFETEFLDEGGLPQEFFQMNSGEVRAFREGIVERTPEGQFRQQTLRVRRLGPPQILAAGSVRDLHHVSTGDEMLISVLAAVPGGSLLLVRAEAGEDMSGAPTLRFEPPLPLPCPEHAGVLARFVRLSGIGDNVYLAWADGHTVRVRTSVPEEAYVAETLDLVPEAGAILTSLEFLLGGATLIAGDSTGSIGGWFLVPSAPGNGGADGFTLAHAKELSLGAGAGAVMAITSGTRRRMFVAGTDQGRLGVFYMTSAERLVLEEVPGAAALQSVAISPKEDALLGATAERLLLWDFEPRHPEASLTGLFAPVWYEGFAEPQFTWQSSSGTDDFEPKFGLMPLVFGTLKATFYSLLFGAPLALLAAIFTSEFLDPRWKAWIKPTIEMMASLPSVVLGFLAAIVFAPFIARFIPVALAAVFSVPISFLCGAFVWQLLPRRIALRAARHRIVYTALALVPGLVLAAAVGRPLEGVLFDGDIKSWLNGLHQVPAVGRPLGGWVLLLLPLTALVVVFAMTQWISPRLRRLTEHMERRSVALLSLLNFLAGAAVTVVLVVVGGLVLGALGLDVRKPLPAVGSFLDTFDQRNTLVVGFVMGFAVIPIIYTIAEDALSTVPEHLRSASLGSGATPWQTAVRIVIPTAMSGLFSALMIGLGRAVGETMIVLMATGNTPVMNMNVFEGFRTLAANIAVELPEAHMGGTHCRALFLAALTLFAMTFVVNTAAEAVRLRFRRRAYQL